MAPPLDPRDEATSLLVRADDLNHAAARLLDQAETLTSEAETLTHRAISILLASIGQAPPLK